MLLFSWDTRYEEDTNQIESLNTRLNFSIYTNDTEFLQPLLNKTASYYTWDRLKVNMYCTRMFKSTFGNLYAVL